jgi:hypothetical protein
MQVAFRYFAVFWAVALALALFGSACSNNTPAFEGITNRGITPVSPDSPYIGSNVFLAQEMEHSLFLYNFIKSRGAPQAIQLQGNAEMTSEMMLFYSGKNEYYSAIPRIDPNTKGREWIIRGPFPITREQYPYVAHLTPDKGGVFELFGRQERFGGTGEALEYRVINPAFIPTPRPTSAPTKKRAKKKATAQEASGPQIAVPGIPAPGIAVQGTPVNLDQEALFEARRTPSVTPTIAATIQIAPKTADTPNTSDTTGRPSLGAALKSAVNTTPDAPSTLKTK